MVGEEIISIQAKYKKKLVEKTFSLFREGKYDKALESCNRILLTDPNDIEAVIYKGAILDKLGRSDEADKYFNKASRSREADNYYKAVTFFEVEIFEKAIEFFNKALTIDPNDTDSLMYIGIILDRVDRPNEAIGYLDSALAIDSERPKLWLNKATILASLTKYDQALECINKALSIDSNYQIAWYNKGAILDKLGRHNEAIKAYSKASSIVSNDVDD